ncbi:MAG: hypothetical protein K2R93_18895 [Gemmatimonadaceae bacterium]|nr:hypothetical protein [Gemmatimonadaceae bacterium]
MGIVLNAGAEAALLWGRGSEELLYISANKTLATRRLPVPAERLLAVAFDKGENLVWIDSGGHQGAQGRQPASGESKLTFSTALLRLESAVWFDGKWFATSINRDSSASLWSLDGAPKERLRIYPEHKPLHPYVERAFVTTVHGALAVVSRYYPFRVIRLDSTLAIRDTIIFDMPAMDSSGSVRRNNAALFVLAALSDRRAINLSLSDPFSLRRVVLSNEAPPIEGNDGSTPIARFLDGTTVSVEPVSRGQLSLRFRKPQ